MSTDQLTKDQEVAKYRAALERIANFDCHPYVEADPGAIAEQTECADCKRCAERNWPPSHLCDKHYRSLICERESKQHHKEMCVKYEMKDIAREALRNE